ncbi:MAG: hypothetical protein Q9223_006881 [Gallowayella weberi]
MRSTYIYAAAAAIVRASAASTSADITRWVTQYETECFTETSGLATSTGTVVATSCPHCTEGASSGGSQGPGSPGSPGSPSQPKGPLTTYTTVYPETCSTGLQPKTYTVTEECSSTGAPRAPDYVPSAFVVTTVTCHVCGETPVVATLTTPAPVAPSAAPAGSAPVPAPAAPTVGGSSPAAPPSSGAMANPPAAPNAQSPPPAGAAPNAESPPPAGPAANPPAAPNAASPPSPGTGPAAGPAAKAPYSPLATGASGAPISPYSPITPFTGSASSLVPASFILMIMAMFGALAIAL